MIHLFLGHYVADHAFTDNTKIRKYKGVKLIEHIIWSVFAILAFTFDTLLKSTRGITVLAIFTLIHIVGDIFRTKIGSDVKKVYILESVEFAIAVVMNFLIANLLRTSFISKEFALYLFGMGIVSMTVTYILRDFILKDETYSDLDGISERLAFYVFFLAGNYLFALLSLVFGFLYRYWKVRKFNKVWWISPFSSVIISIIFKIIVF